MSSGRGMKDKVTLKSHPAWLRRSPAELIAPVLDCDCDPTRRAAVHFGSIPEEALCSVENTQHFFFFFDLWGYETMWKNGPRQRHRYVVIEPCPVAFKSQGTWVVAYM